jgi:hypothetical protein
MNRRVCGAITGPRLNLYLGNIGAELWRKLYHVLVAIAASPALPRTFEGTPASASRPA